MSCITVSSWATRSVTIHTSDETCYKDMDNCIYAYGILIIVLALEYK